MPRFTAIVLFTLVLLSLLGGLMANQRPLWCQLNGQSKWPIFEGIFNKGIQREYLALDEGNGWQTLPPSDRIMPIIPFSATEKSRDLRLPPLSTVHGIRHWLGTDEAGRDVAAGIIAGARTALLTAFLALLIAFLVGGTLGGIAGFWGNQLHIRRNTLGVGGFSIAILLFVLLGSRIAQTTGWSTAQTLYIGTFTLVLSVFTVWVLQKWGIGNQKVAIPADLIIMRLAEIFESIPGLILLLVAVSLLKERTLFKVVLLIGFFSWSSCARYLRAELLKVRQMDYITAVRGLGIPEWQILWKHAIPNAIRPVLLTLTLSASGAILIESGLSFLNLGSNDITEMTWGKMLQSARNEIDVWWVWLSPGIMIAITSAAFFEWNDQRRA